MVRLTVLALAFLASTVRAAPPGELLVHDEKSQPESLTLRPDGALVVGSAGSPSVYLVRKGATAAEILVDASAEGPGTFFFGQLADAATGTLWACQLTPVPGTTPVTRHSVLRGFDLESGKEKQRWTLPGDNNVCNDMTVGPDRALYISDTIGAKIYRLPAGAPAPELFLENRVLTGVDGITFLDGALYVTNVFFNKLYRIPIDASGKAGTPVDIWMDAPVKGPDGMRAGGGRLLLAENGAGKIDVLTITGDVAHIRVIADGLKTPTAVEPFGDRVWFTERATGKVRSIPIRK
jgi:hypothetical protein